jgi:hypothetical protein
VVISLSSVEVAIMNSGLIEVNLSRRFDDNKDPLNILIIVYVVITTSIVLLLTSLVAVVTRCCCHLMLLSLGVAVAPIKMLASIGVLVSY